MQELVSVIIPVYKVENYIDKCMETVLSQSYENLEILLVDDGSPDNCGRICEDYAAKDSRVKVIHKMNGGLSSARNAALDVMTGKWVVCIDSDDYVHRDYVKDLYEAAIRHKADIAVGSHYQEKGDQLSITEKIFDEEVCYDRMQALHKLVEDDYIKNYAWGKIYRAELFEGVRYPDGRNYEDIATTYYLFDKSERIVKIPNYLYYYIIRDDSISFNKSRQMWHKGCHASCLGQQERCEYFKKKGYEELYNLAQARLLPYLYSDITSGYSDDAHKDVRDSQDYIRAHRGEFEANPYVSRKDKKLLGVYLKGQGYYKVYSETKNYFNRAYRIFRKSRGKIKILRNSGGFELTEGRKKRLVYFELPCFDNLGDHAIAYAAEEILRSFCDETEYQLFVVDGWNVDSSVSALKKCLSPEDVFVCQGGGNFGSLYDFAEVFRRKVFKAFRGNRIILMPQTCFYAEDEEGKRALEADKEAIEKCSDLTLYARDMTSYEFMKNNFRAKVEFLHDTVSLYDATEWASKEREGIVVCLRSDKEGKLTLGDKKIIISECEKKRKVMVTDTCTNYDVATTEREKVLKDKWKLWGKSELVVTDRLHGMIFALITGTPCIVIGNNHFKVYEAYKTFSGAKYLLYLESLEELPDAVEKMLALNREDCCREGYGSDLDTLRNSIISQ